LGITFIHVTHSQDEAMALSDEIVLMNNAVIEQTGTPIAVFNRPNTEFVARFMGGHNIVQSEGKRYAIRTDRTQITKNDAGVQADVSNVEFLGRSVDVTLDYQGTDIIASLSDDQYQSHPITEGETVSVYWESNDLHALRAS